MIHFYSAFSKWQIHSSLIILKEGPEYSSITHHSVIHKKQHVFVTKWRGQFFFLNDFHFWVNCTFNCAMTPSWVCEDVWHLRSSAIRLQLEQGLTVRVSSNHYALSSHIAWVATGGINDYGHVSLFSLAFTDIWIYGGHWPTSSSVEQKLKCRPSWRTPVTGLQHSDQCGRSNI